MELSPQEKRQVEDTDLALPQPKRSEFTGAQDTPFPVLAMQPQGSSLCALPTDNPLGPAAAQTLLPGKQRETPLGLLGNISGQPERCLEEPAPKAPSTLRVSIPSAVLPAGAHRFAHPINSVAPPLRQATRRATLPTESSTEITELITKAGVKANCPPRLRPLQKPDKKVALPMAQQLGPPQNETRQTKES